METVPSWPRTQMTSSAVQRAMSLPLCVAGSDASNPQGKSCERMRVRPLRSRALEMRSMVCPGGRTTCGGTDLRLEPRSSRGTVPSHRSLGGAPSG